MLIGHVTSLISCKYFSAVVHSCQFIPSRGRNERIVQVVNKICILVRARACANTPACIPYDWY